MTVEIRRLLDRWRKPRRHVDARPISPYTKTYWQGVDEGRQQCARELERVLLAAPAVPPLKNGAEIRRLLDVLAAARDAMAAFGKQAGAVPGQDGYSTRMTEGEHQLATAVAAIENILAEYAAELAAPAVPAPQEEVPHADTTRAELPTALSEVREVLRSDFRSRPSVQAEQEGGGEGASGVQRLSVADLIQEWQKMIDAIQWHINADSLGGTDTDHARLDTLHRCLGDVEALSLAALPGPQEDVLRKALDAIAAGHPAGDCGCTHDDEHCCAKVGEWCAVCLAATALAAVPAQEEGWHPMEMAPKDRTSVIVFCPLRSTVGEAFFDPDSYGGTWWWANQSEDYYTSPMRESGYEPTHWMPLPQPPGAPAAQEEAVKQHRCMRCLEVYDCPEPSTCQAQFDVLPAPEGQPFVHTCPKHPDWDWIRGRIQRERDAFLKGAPAAPHDARGTDVTLCTCGVVTGGARDPRPGCPVHPK